MNMDPVQDAANTDAHRVLGTVWLQAERFAAPSAGGASA